MDDTPYSCPICGNTDIHSIGFLNGKPYCRKCITFKGEEAFPLAGHWPRMAQARRPGEVAFRRGLVPGNVDARCSGVAGRTETAWGDTSRHPESVYGAAGEVISRKTFQARWVGRGGAGERDE